MKQLLNILKFLPWSAAVLALVALLLNSVFDQSEALYPALESGVKNAQQALQSRELPAISSFNWHCALLIGLFFGGLIGAAWKHKFAVEIFPVAGGFKGVWQGILLPLLAGAVLVLGYQIGAGSLLKNFAQALNLIPGGAVFLGAFLLTILLLTAIFHVRSNQTSGSKKC